MADLLDIHISLAGTAFPSPALRCYDWSDLLKSPPKRGSNRVIAGETGRLARNRVADEARVALRWRVNGRYQHPTGAEFVGDDAARHSNVYTLLGVLRALADDPEPQQLQLVGVMGSSVDCLVEEMTAPSFESPWVATFVLDVTLPDGPIVLSGGS